MDYGVFFDFTKITGVRVTSFTWLMVSCFAPLSAEAESETNHGYPLGVVPLKAGILVCETLDQVEQMFANWKASYDERMPEHVVMGCGRTAVDYHTSIEYIGPFENEHWSADLLRFRILKPAAPGLLVFDRDYFGFGSATIKEGVLGKVRRPQYH